MKLNQWTLGLAAAGVIGLPSAVRAEEETLKALLKVKMEPEKPEEEATAKQPKEDKPWTSEPCIDKPSKT